MNRKILLLFQILLFSIILGCTKEGHDGKTSLIDMIPEPIGENCIAGGIKIISGIDLDNNNILDENEIQDSAFICHGNDGSLYYDKLVRLVISYHGITTTSANWDLISSTTHRLSDFNRDDYGLVDSIIFGPPIYTENSNNTCIVELYNLTDGVPIQNSMIETNNTEAQYHYSTNIYEYLPSKRIDLGIRIRSEIEGQRVFVGEISYLYIYRN